MSKRIVSPEPEDAAADQPDQPVEAAPPLLPTQQIEAFINDATWLGARSPARKHAIQQHLRHVLMLLRGVN